jgi:hypothetical protein
VVLLAGCASTRPVGRDAAPDPFLWRVTQSDRPGTLYLLGSVHLRDPANAPLDRAVWDAVDAADTVILEADVANQMRLAIVTMKLGMLPPTQSLEDHVADGTYALLLTRLEELGGQRATFDRMRPWLAALSYLALQMQAEGLSPEGGVDVAIREAATARGVQLRFLETAEQQLRLFADLDPPLQEAMLLDALEDEAGAEAQMTELLDIYASGDLDALEAALLGPFEDAPQLRARLLDDRNAAWMPTLTSAFERDGVTLAAVGAGHLVGEHGLLALLRDRDADVERVQGVGVVEADPGALPPADPRATLQAWKRHDAAALGFSIELPAEPRREDVPPLLQLEAGLRWIVDRGVFAFSITALAFSELAAPALERDADRILADTFRDAAREVGGELGERSELKVRGGRGQAQVVDMPGGRLWIRGYVIDGRVYELRAVLTNDVLEDPRFLEAKDRFFDSFILTGPAQMVRLDATPALARRGP